MFIFFNLRTFDKEIKSDTFKIVKKYFILNTVMTLFNSIVFVWIIIPTYNIDIWRSSFSWMYFFDLKFVTFFHIFLTLFSNLVLNYSFNKIFEIIKIVFKVLILYFFLKHMTRAGGGPVSQRKYLNQTRFWLKICVTGQWSIPGWLCLLELFSL